MRRSLLIAVSAVALLSTAAFAPAPQTAPDASAYAAALAEPGRPEADRARDEARHTAETLAFAGVAPGQKIADMAMGGGYFTRVLAAAVGPEGHITAWQPDEFVAFAASYGTALAAVDALPNVDGVQSPFASPAFPPDLDLVLTAQNYHDLHLASFASDTAARLNAAVFAALRPGGAYVIVDHQAVAGSDLAVAESLHRIDPETVKREVTAAGFVLEAESDVLLNPDDPLTASVFAPSIRGRTSQFMLRFRKPG